MTSLGKGIGPPWAHSAGRSSSPAAGSSDRARYSTSSAPIKEPKPPNQNAGGGGNGGGKSGGGGGRGRGRSAQVSDSPQPVFGNVVYLLNMDGADAHTTFTDLSNSAHGNATQVGTADGDTTIFKFGTASMDVKSADDQGYTEADNVDFSFGSGDFSVEAWCYWDVLPTGAPFRVAVSQYRTNGNQRSWALGIKGSIPCIEFRYSTLGSDTVQVFSEVAEGFLADTWHHLAVCRDGGTIRLFLDGTEVHSESIAVTLHNSTTDLVLGGARSSGTIENHLGEDDNAWIDGVRIIKGQAIYTKDFTAPTVAFPTS